MKVTETSLPGVLLLEPRLFTDSRGWFAEFYNERVFAEAGLPSHFIQDNQSHSTEGVLRGMHYQLGAPQGKLVRVLSGTIYDAVVDLRPGSPTRGQWAGFELSSENRHILWIPEDFAHGFKVLSKTADVLYKVTKPYDSRAERTLRWDDPEVNILWPGSATPVLSSKDADGKFWSEAELPVA
ncbi:dTDP-4-dehydrorhamnose 3,5-epimerase [Acidipila rosea]|uniref:dTDP-4-dehydrorhamnose 3,5-epimerase n=1 Tax=Acidipila rosea TaxID=768535 RepID=A0A4R1LEH3_9BACT|nr:dTDP-4-dehydrorhamnose 3,5-epimerase [Acidipila rosea]TCK75039.1 dTDP-4-dehydrorhamnose 3,5-epimerase [Acidipila rosea]